MIYLKKKNEVEYNIDYGKVLEMKKLINREITNIEEYVQWVKDWRMANHAMVGSIQFMRDRKNQIKVGHLTDNATSRETLMHRAYCTKLALRPYAKELYDLRVKNKERFKAGEFGDPTFQPREVAVA